MGLTQIFQNTEIKIERKSETLNMCSFESPKCNLSPFPEERKKTEREKDKNLLKSLRKDYNVL